MFGVGIISWKIFWNQAKSEIVKYLKVSSFRYRLEFFFQRRGIFFGEGYESILRLYLLAMPLPPTRHLRSASGDRLVAWQDGRSGTRKARDVWSASWKAPGRFLEGS